MKKISILSFIFLMLTTGLIAQSPFAFNFQGIARDMNGNPLPEKTIGLEFALIQGDPQGPIIYLESHEVTTNMNALFSVAIGRGFVRFGNLQDLDWSLGPFFMRTALDETGGENYKVVGTSELLSVPFALYALNAGGSQWGNLGDDLYYNQGNIGIGTDSPDDKIHVKGGNLYLENNNDGVIMKSPSGACWKLSVNDQGQSIWTATTCPGESSGNNPSMFIDPDILNFSFTENEKPITLINNGDQIINWSLNYPGNFITISPATGSLVPGQSAELTVSVNRIGMPETINEYNISVLTDVGIQIQLETTVNNIFVQPSQISSSPDILTLDETETGSLFLSVDPLGVFDWNVTSKPSWIELSPSSGTIDNQDVEVIVTANTNGLNPGLQSGTIRFSSTGAGTTQSIVQVNVEARPEASVTDLNFRLNDNTEYFVIQNIGTGTLDWNIGSLPDWLELNRNSGSLNAGQTVSIRADVDRTGMPFGTQTGQIIIESNSINGDISANVSVEVPQIISMSVSTEELHINYQENNETFVIVNDGNTSFDWTWDNNTNTYLTSSPNSGSIAAGDSIEVTVTVDRTGFEIGSLEALTIISNDSGQSSFLTITVDHYVEEKWLIKGRVIDAEYDRNNDVIVAISEVPNELRKFNPTTNSFQSTTLNIPPKCVSISQDGKYAAVGHDGYFAYVNLQTMAIEKTYAVTADVFDIVLAPNNWAYIMPRVDQWERMRCIDLQTGVETEQTGNLVNAGTKIKLHPNGNYIYGANNGLSPSDFEKYDITNGTAVYLYDSPYHGDYAFSGDLWISDEGNRLFARSRNVFNSSVIQDNDMTYNGKLVGEGTVTTLDYSSAANRVYAVFTRGNSWDREPAFEVSKYENSFLAFQGTTKLPPFLIPDGTGGGTLFDSEGHFGFFNTAGTRFYVMVKVSEGSGAQDEWAIATLEVD